MNGGQVGEMSDPYRSSRRPEWTVPTGTEATTARVAEVLAEHDEPRAKAYPDDPWKHDGTYVCSCGDEFMAEHGAGGLAIAHRAHVAAALSAGVIRDMQAAALREAADETDLDLGPGYDGADDARASNAATRWLRDRAARIEEQR